MDFFDEQPIFLLARETHDILDVNEHATNIYGYERAHFLSLNIADLGEKYRGNGFQKNPGTDHSEPCTVWLHKTKYGNSIYVQFTMHAFNYEGNPVKLALVHNVTKLIEREETDAALLPQKQALVSGNESRQMTEEVEQLRRSLKEKETLLAEIHHRVKNNLAVINGLLELQSYNAPSEKVKQVLHESQIRITTIALIHEKLYQSDDLSQVSFDVYIKELTDVICHSLGGGSIDIQMEIDADPVYLTINQAVPCGLIINELITNAFKHAFRDRGEGKITIELNGKDSNILLKVSDNGCGLPEDLNFENPQSLGMTLIGTLSKQLGGVYDLSGNANGEGTQFLLKFELEEGG